MRKDFRIKIRPGSQFSSKYVRYQLVKLLELSQELEAVYQTYPKLRRLVGYRAWQQLTDTVYRELLMLNLEPRNDQLREQVQSDVKRLEQLVSSTVVRDRAGLKQTLSQVLMFRITHNLATR